MQTTTQIQIIPGIYDNIVDMILRERRKTNKIDIADFITPELGVEVKATIIERVTPASFRGNYYCPPDPDTVEYEVLVQKAELYNEESDTIGILDTKDLENYIQEAIN